ncbi:Fibronectin type III domain protein [Pelomyxa schiedti]|nr:Fibronectin type III domain protein [Pelomyxa schiedti]
MDRTSVQLVGDGCPVVARLTTRELWPRCRAEMDVVLQKQWREERNLSVADVFSIGTSAKCCDCHAFAEVLCKQCKGPGGKVLDVGIKEHSPLVCEDGKVEIFSFTVKQFCTSSKSHIRESELLLMLDFGKGFVVSTTKFRLIARLYSRTSPAKSATPTQSQTKTTPPAPAPPFSACLFSTYVRPVNKPTHERSPKSPKSPPKNLHQAVPVKVELSDTSSISTDSTPRSGAEIQALIPAFKCPPVVVRMFTSSATYAATLKLTTLAQETAMFLGALMNICPITNRGISGLKYCVTLAKYNSMVNAQRAIDMFDSMMHEVVEYVANTTREALKEYPDASNPCSHPTFAYDVSGYWNGGHVFNRGGNLAPGRVVSRQREWDDNYLYGWTLDVFTVSGEHVGGFPLHMGSAVSNLSPTLYDIDGDGLLDILVAFDKNITALSGDGSILWQTKVDRNNYIPDSGYMVIPGTFYWSDGGVQLDLLPSTSEFYSQVSPPLIVDSDGDGKKEVLTTWKIDPDTTSSYQDYNPEIKPVYGFADWGTVGETWSGGAVFLDMETGEMHSIYHFVQLVESGAAVGKVDDATLVYVLSDSDSIEGFDNSKPHGYQGKGKLHGDLSTWSDITAADIDGDGQSEILVCTTQIDPLWTPHETVLDDSGVILWREWKEEASYTHNYGWQNSAVMFAINPDQDNHVDVITFSHEQKIHFREWNGIALVEKQGWPIDFAPLLPVPPVVGDIDGDGEEEIIIATYNPEELQDTGSGINVYSLSGVLKRHIDIPGGVKHIPTIYDIDRDGSVELIFRSCYGVITITNLADNSRTGSVSWATHRGNVLHDSIPGVSLFKKGTPIISSKTEKQLKASFCWRLQEPPGSVTSLKIYRSQSVDGPFAFIISLPSSANCFEDQRLEPGILYIYEIEATYSTGETLRSSPLPMLSLVNNNLVLNSGIEGDDDYAFDKWYTGSIPWEHMTGSPTAYQGEQSMSIILAGETSCSSISQWNQYGIPDSTIYTTPGLWYSFGGFLKSQGVDIETEHWFEWSSPPTGYDPEAHPSPPWPNYWTPHLVAPAGTATAWLYTDRVFLLPDGYPNVCIRHRWEGTGSATGVVLIDNLFFRELPASPLDGNVWTTVLPYKSVWRYLVGTVTPASNWFDPSFDDSAWSVGTAKFGAGSGPQNVTTHITSSQQYYYFRTNFTFGDTEHFYGEVLLAVICSDSFPIEIWINGNNPPTTGISVCSGQGNTPGYFDMAPFYDYLVPNSTNIVAVRLENTWATSWDDLAFDFSVLVVEDNMTDPFGFSASSSSTGTLSSEDTSDAILCVADWSFLVLCLLSFTVFY